MKNTCILSILLIFLSNLSGQTDWRLDSTELFQISQGNVADPFSYTYHYNINGELIKETGSTFVKDYYYGSNKVKSYLDHELSGKIEKYTEFNEEGSPVYNRIERFFDDGNLKSKVEEYYYRSDNLDSIYEFTNDILSNIFLYTYENSKISTYERRSDDGTSEYFTYEYDNLDRIKRLTRDYYYGSPVLTNFIVEEYFYEENVDILHHYRYDILNEFQRGNTLITRQEDECTVIDSYDFYQEDRGDSELVKITRTQANLFPHSEINDIEEYDVEAADTIVSLLKSYTYEEVDDKHFELQEIKQIFTGGELDFLETSFSQYSRNTQYDENLSLDVDVTIFSNPVQSDTYFQVQLDQKLECTLIVYNAEGRLVKEKNVGSKEHILLNAPNQAGVYFIGFIDHSGNRSKLRCLVVQ